MAKASKLATQPKKGWMGKLARKAKRANCPNGQVDAHLALLIGLALFWSFDEKNCYGEMKNLSWKI